MGMRHWRTALVLAALASIPLGSKASLALTESGGGERIRVMTRAETEGTEVRSTTFVNLDGASIPLKVPNNSSRHIIARFAAESNCGGPVEASGHNCMVRIVAVRSNGRRIQLDPAEATDFGFDSVQSGTGQDSEESHAIEGSKRLSEGTYTIRVQVAVSSSAAIFIVDDWHFTVEVSE